MCEFCHKHGEGKKWYLEAQNYSEDFLSDLRRRKFIHDFLGDPEKLIESDGQLKRFHRLPSFVKAVVTPLLTSRQKKVHFGQVVPIEDIERIFSFVNSAVRLPCICRQTTVGSEQRYCYGISVMPWEESQFGQTVRTIDASYLIGPGTKGLEVLSKEETLTSLRELEKRGLCHTIWTIHHSFYRRYLQLRSIRLPGYAFHCNHGLPSDVPCRVCC